MSIVLFSLFVVAFLKGEDIYNEELIAWALFCIADYSLLSLIFGR